MQRVPENRTKVCSAKLGVVPMGHPEKRRHSDCFAVQNVLFDWDTQTSAEKRRHSDCFAVQNVLLDWDTQTSADTVNEVQLHAICA